MKLIIKGGHIVDPANNLDEVLDILVENNKISKVGKNIKTKADKIIDAKGKVVMPGLIDLHVHLREPGREDKETVKTATYAAAKGGVTSLLAMPNTNPVMDCAKNVNLLKSIIEKDAKVNVFIAGAITKGRLGEKVSDIGSLRKQGISVVTDDGSSVDDEEVMKLAFRKAKENNVLVMCHCEDKSLSMGGVVNFGFTSTRLGLRGIPNGSEHKRVARDIEIAANENAKIHIAHVSCKESVDIITQAKRKGINVSAETAPHYFYLYDKAVLGFDTNMKMNPPLRSKEDAVSIKRGLKSGAIDVIASDHAPHTENEKDIEFERAAFGVIGLETELAVSVTDLVNTRLLSLSDLVRKMSYNPAKILGIDKGTLREGSDADIIVVSVQKEWVVKKEKLISKSKNSSFLNRKLRGVVECTICAGKIVYSNKQ